MITDKADLYKLLIGCLKKDNAMPDAASLAALPPAHWRDLLALAAMQRVTPLLWHRLKQKELDGIIPDEISTSLREASRRNALNNLRLTGELRALLSALAAENIPLILLKGIVLANTVYDNMGLREMNDIDVLARPEHLERIADILMQTGYRPLQPYCKDNVIKTGHHLPRFIKKGYAHFELHWNITSPDHSYSIAPVELWERAVPTQIAGHNTLTLSPEDMLLHVCLHTSYLHPFTFGLRPFCDITVVIDHFGLALNWETIVDRACRQRWQRGVYLALRLAVELAGAAVPVGSLKRLEPADVSEVLLKTVRDQIFTDKYFAVSIPAPFAELLQSKRLIDKLNIFRKRVLLPRAVMANVYAVPINSPMIYGCYLRRFCDVLRRHVHTLQKFQQNDDDVMSLVERTNLIADWME